MGHLALEDNHVADVRASRNEINAVLILTLCSVHPAADDVATQADNPQD
jgi:hypothetical protein